jgi:hypothetical protein
MANITIGSRLPYGLILEVGDKKVTIEGVNKSNIIGAEHYTTEVDAQFWAAWTEANAEFPAYVNGTIFAIEDKRAEKSIIRDAFARLTGLEKIAPDSDSIVKTLKMD